MKKSSSKWFISHHGLLKEALPLCTFIYDHGDSCGAAPVPSSLENFPVVHKALFLIHDVSNRANAFFLANGTNLKSQMDFPTHFQTLLFITISGEEIIPKNLLVLILGISGNDRFVAQLVEETFKMPPWSFCLLHNLVLFSPSLKEYASKLRRTIKCFSCVGNSRSQKLSLS